MKTTMNGQAEKVKEMIKATEEKSRQVIREIIATEHKHMDQALEATKVLADTIKDKLREQHIENKLGTNLEQTMDNSIKLAEEGLDEVINAYSRQMELNINFNTKLVDALRLSNFKDSDELLKIILDNFEASRQLTMDNTKRILDMYSKHTDLGLSVNKQFGENLYGLMQSWQEVQTKGMTMLTGWASDWWKHIDGNGKVSTKK